MPLMQKRHDALWNSVVEPKAGHDPREKTWPLVFSFLRHTLSVCLWKWCCGRAGS